MANKRVTVQLEQSELEFVKWLAKNDKITLNEELACMLKLQLSETMQLYIEEGYYKAGATV